MALQKHKMTGFSRLLIFMIFFVPIAYIGASYYNGEDGIQNIKDILGFDKKSSQKESNYSKRSGNDCVYELRQKDMEIARLRQLLESK